MNKLLRLEFCALLLAALCATALAAAVGQGAPQGAQGGGQGGYGPNRGGGFQGQYGGPGRGRGGRGRGSDEDLLPPPAKPSNLPAQDVKPIAGEQFYIIASVDQTKQELLLKRPTEVTTLIKTSDKTQFFDDTGHPLRLTDFRAGDTVWVASGKSASSEPVATRIRKGQMTVADLHKLYLDYAEIK